MVEKMAEILQKQSELVNAKQASDFTPTHYACHRGNLRMLKLLLLFGADLYATSKNGVTCLHLACCVSGSLELVKFLIEEKKIDCKV